MLALALSYALRVPLGQPDYLVYRYSDVAAWRLIKGGIPILILAGLGLYLLRQGMRRPRGFDAPARSAFPKGHAVGVWLCWAGVATAVFVAPPGYVLQHFFNLRSPSHDGAFLEEAKEVESLRSYLGHEFHRRLQLDPDQLRGTRVLSNPPGMTLMAYGVTRAVAGHPRLQAWADSLFHLDEIGDAEIQRLYAESLYFGILLTVLWAAALPVGYGLGRLWLAPAPAAAVALACVFNPATLNFTPGKDPAQMLTVLGILYTGLSGYLKGDRRWSLACGVVFALSLTIGLIHLWIAFVVAVATAWGARRRLREWWTRCLLPAAAGFLATCGLIYVFLDWNLLHAVYLVARRYPEIQKYLIHGWYTLVGLPLFLLFAGPTFWALFVRLSPARSDDDVSRLGLILIRASAAVMTYCYFFANNNETPRLWMPFLALLTVALSMRESLFRTDSADTRRTLGWMLILQVGLTVLHWSLLDVRETEWRLAEGRNWE